MKNKPLPTKRTYTKNELWILLIQEAFKRDLNLFNQLINQTSGFFSDSKVPSDWTFTVVSDESGSKLVVNKPSKKT